MKRTIKHVLYTLFTAIILVSCASNASLQSYFVDNQEASNFISQDLPLSMVKLDQTTFSEEQKEAYNSVNKLNFLGYKANENNAEALKAEIKIIKAILKDSKYKDLMEFNDKGRKISVKYIGTDDEADEVVVFGHAKELGFAIVRVLGDDMSPDKMVTLITALQKANVDENQVQDIMNFFK
ncbi:DUF4252 domain-containing protein [Flavivirga spongiicola]|uniref:DUF4252 domain-containing protein n=1 Tax=Flavivirga spongiicola TaxID=421621 RepID=A0ABU7XQE8_9FLAO|nr:DUF4252 domain-containing protein [Flavivirga sp. MEBiC05379]MDO5977668.1 DUF4252 domain-containing protein [Flavivirga sp. MEBiC05379]